MTVTTAVDFLLENMTRLMNCDNKLILKAYEETRIEKEQMELVFKEMQFLGKFLKDSEEKRYEHDQKLKDIAAKIRVVTDKVEDIIDWFVFSALFQVDGSMVDDFPDLLSCFPGKMVKLSKKICDGFKLLVEGLSSFRTLKEKLKEILPPRFISLIEEINKMDDSFPLDSRRRLISTGFESKIPDEFRFLLSLSDLMVHGTQKNCDFFGSVIGEIKPFKEDVLHFRVENLSQGWPKFYMADDFRLLLSLSKEIRELAKEISDVFCFLMNHNEKYAAFLKVVSFRSNVTDEFHRLSRLHRKMVKLAKKILHGLNNVMEEVNSMKKEVMDIYEKGSRLISWINCLTTEDISYGFGSVLEEIKSIKTEVMEIIYEKNMCDIKVLQKRNSAHGNSSKPRRSIVDGEKLVGFDDETRTVMELLTEEHEKQLKVIAIVGMPGLGKTTLARKVYNDPFIGYHFYIRSWIYVSQVYQKKDLLLAIFLSAFHPREEICKMRDDKLGEELYKRLKGKRYLIIMDDIWNMGAWNDLKSYLPNDNNGSRILFTTRNEDVIVTLRAKSHHLRFLNEDESWDLLQQKTFGEEICPLELVEIGRQIAKKCQGLPLAVVVISGLLAKEDKTEEWWRHVAESVSSYIVSDPEQYMDTLALSYNLLPHHLKACFLYFGAFPEDYEIPVRLMIWLWVAEGFIRQNEQKTLEEVAEDYLMDLIDRSLVIVSKKRSNGEIKACLVHDLLRALCLRKAHEENFLHQISIEAHENNLLQQISRKVQEENFFEQIFGKAQEENLLQQIFGSPLSEIANKQRRICVHSDLANFTFLNHYCCASRVRSILSFRHSDLCDNLYMGNVSFIHQDFIHLKILNLSSIQIPLFPNKITQLLLLRYLALHVGQQQIVLPSIANLLNLQTLIVKGLKGLLVLSNDIWTTVNLRHLYAERLIEFSSIPNDGHPFVLDNLQTVGKLHLYSGEERALKWIPNLKKLKCYIRKMLNGDDHFPKLDFLIHLETLNVISSECKRFFHPDNFPPCLKSLTLSYVGLSWEEMSTLGMLPNLEVLKLLDEAFEGSRWDTNDGGFRKLRFLKFQGLDIGQWNASSSHFPYLQQLVLEECARLEEIPSGLGDITTLEIIQLRDCSRSAENSAREIQEQQMSMGNDGIRIQTLACRRKPEMMIIEDSAI